MKIISNSAEAKLIELLKDIEIEADAWHALCFNFSRLEEYNKSDNKMKIAINLIKDLCVDLEGVVYLFDDYSLYVLLKGVSQSLLDKMVFQLRYLFMEDPLAYSGEGEENAEFSHLYHLEDDWEGFQDLSQLRLQAIVKKRTQRRAKKDEAFAAENDVDVSLLTAAKLSGIESDLMHADMSRVLRRQPVCAVAGNGMGHVQGVFDEMYVNIAHLQTMLGLKVNLLSNKWLFKYLTEILDERMLAMVQRSPSRYLEEPISLNLNVKTLLSKQFMEFDAVTKPAMKVSIVIEVQVADVYTDMTAFLTALETVQSLGYRVCLDGVSESALALIDRKQLGFDLLKMIWNARGVEEVGSDSYKRIQEGVERCGKNRIILCRCDNEEAVEFGKSLGISLFQGRYLDKHINPQSTILN